jgi:hypothetical protein
MPYPIPIVDITNGALLNMKWCESVFLALLEEQSDDGWVGFFMTHDLDCY